MDSTNTMTMTKTEIIRDTIKYYCDTDENRFSVDGHHCVYRGPGGRMCAVGRFIPDCDYRAEMEVASIGTVMRELRDVIPHSTSPLFWQRLQKRHDTAAKLTLDSPPSALRDAQAHLRASLLEMLEDYS